ncbi:MAG TPA: SPOR domain-containing protein [Acidobacteriota bacterium]|nr:SPOR domain-containing protein [Acidobacteriota bacterium]
MNGTKITCDRVRPGRLLPVLIASALLGGTYLPALGAPKDSDAFDPLGFPGDSVVVTDDVKAAGHRPSDARLRRPSGLVDTAATEIVLQVQFLATTNLTEARDVKERAETALKDSVRLEFETPYYKLCTGRFVDYDEAEALAVRLRRMGYESAWVVRVKKPALENSRVE